MTDTQDLEQAYRPHSIGLETSKYVPVSEATLAFTDPSEHAHDLIGPGSLAVESCTKIDNETPKWGQIEGLSSVPGEVFSYRASILVKFPGLFEKLMARAKNREPRAVVHLTISGKPSGLSALNTDKLAN